MELRLAIPLEACLYYNILDQTVAHLIDNVEQFINFTPTQQLITFLKRVWDFLHSPQATETLPILVRVYCICKLNNSQNDAIC